MKKIAILLASVLLLGGVAYGQCVGGNCYQVPVYVVPPVVYRPQVTYMPYRYDRSTYMPRQYRTPLRDRLFGVGVITHYYRPAQPQAKGQDR